MAAAEEAGEGVAWDGDAVGGGERSEWSDHSGKSENREKSNGKAAMGGKKKKRVWTAYVVAFGQLELEMGKVLRGSGYGVCWRGWNGWGNEDWRRRGGMVVWCLDEGEKRRWRDVERERERRRREGWTGWRRFLGV